MTDSFRIYRANAEPAVVEGLADVLLDCVAGGASVGFMHPLPRDSTPGAIDLATDLDRDPRLAIFRQTDNGIPIRMAVFALLLGVDQLVHRSMRDASWTSPAQVGPGERNPS